LLPEYRSEENEDLLLRAALDDLWKTPALYRVEAQLMLLHRPLEREVPYASRFRAFPRQFLEIDFESIAALPPREVAIPITAWSDNRRAEGSRLISQAYAGHIDSQINDQYRSPGGARKFLTNIIEYPGCGAFYPLASFVATEGRKTGLAGMSLASVVAQGIGHITQACVMPAQRGTGLGYELLRRSLVSLAAHGCRRVSLTVTSANTEAIELYRRMGFTRSRDFAAYVWELR
jgi:ribosomal protein S18 acetylase RimI-like enzyme